MINNKFNLDTDFPPLHSQRKNSENNSQKKLDALISPKKALELTNKRMPLGEIKPQNTPKTPQKNTSGIYKHPNGEIFVSPIKALSFSQKSVSTKTRDGIPLDFLAVNLKEKGWIGAGVKCAFIEGKLVTYDHRRIFASIAAGKRVKVDVDQKYKKRILQRMYDNQLKSPLEKLPYFIGSYPFNGENSENFTKAIKIRGINSPGEHNTYNLLDVAVIKQGARKKLGF